MYFLPPHLGSFQRGVLHPLFGLFFFPYSFCWHKKNMAVGDNNPSASHSFGTSLYTREAFGGAPGGHGLAPYGKCIRRGRLFAVGRRNLAEKLQKS